MSTCINCFFKFYRLLKLVFRLANTSFYVYLIYICVAALGPITWTLVLVSLKQLTLMNMVVNIVYFIMACILEYCGQQRFRSTLLLISSTSSLTVTVLYWIIHYQNPLYLCTGQRILPFWWTYSVHSWPPVANLLDSLLSPPDTPFGVVAIVVIGLAYCGYVIFVEVITCTGDFIYPMFSHLSILERYLVYLCGLLVVFVCLMTVLVVMLVIQKCLVKRAICTKYCKTVKIDTVKTDDNTKTVKTDDSNKNNQSDKGNESSQPDNTKKNNVTNNINGSSKIVNTNKSNITANSSDNNKFNDNNTSLSKRNTVAILTNVKIKSMR